MNDEMRLMLGYGGILGVLYLGIHLGSCVSDFVVWRRREIAGKAGVKQMQGAKEVEAPILAERSQ